MFRFDPVNLVTSKTICCKNNLKIVVQRHIIIKNTNCLYKMNKFHFKLFAPPFQFQNEWRIRVFKFKTHFIPISTYCSLWTDYYYYYFVCIMLCLSLGLLFRSLHSLNVTILLFFLFRGYKSHSIETESLKLKWNTMSKQTIQNVIYGRWVDILEYFYIIVDRKPFIELNHDKSFELFGFWIILTLTHTHV